MSGHRLRPNAVTEELVWSSMLEPAVAPATAPVVGGSKAPLTLRSEWVLRMRPGLDGTS